MNNKQNLGEQFKTAVQDALESKDFRELNNLVTGTVTDVITEAGKHVKKVADGVQKEIHIDTPNNMQEKIKHYQEKQKQRNEQIQKDIKQRQEERQENKVKSSVVPRKSLLPITKNIGQVSSLLYIIFGGIGIGTVIVVFLIGLLCMAIGFEWSAGVFLFLLTGLIGSILLIRKGGLEKERLKRMKRYVSLCAGKMYINIEDLAKQANKSRQYVLKDVKKMLKLGFFPEGHLDEKETCLMLDDATYREYLKLEKERKVLEQEEAEKQKIMQQKQGSQSEKIKQELNLMMCEGQEYIEKLHKMNNLIEGEAISRKLYRMENLLKEIFERVEEDPTQMPQLHKLMNYYLPTTLKLLQAYEEFDNISTPGEDIIKAKAEIEKTVDTINEAFVELLNKLFQDTVFDITTDAQVLQTMLAKEGLTKDFASDFKGNTNDEL